MAFPEGKYRSVYVVDPLLGATLLRNGTGTASSFGVFSCGNFEAGSYPVIGKIYKITAELETDKKSYVDAIPCITTDHQTCQFKDAKARVA